MLALGRLVDLLVGNPAPAVAGDLVPELAERRRRFGMPLQRHADAEHGEREAAPLELAQDAPHADARAVLVDALHGQMTRRKARRIEHLREELLGAGVAVQYRVLAALFVIEDELQRDAGLVGPAGMRRAAAVAGEVTRIGMAGIHGGLAHRGGPAGRAAAHGAAMVAGSAYTGSSLRRMRWA